MTAFLTGLWNYRFTILMFLALTGVVLVYDRGYSDGYSKHEVQVITKVVKIRERQNEILNNRPDDAGLVDRLLNGQF